jgi:hypothetical protein
MKLLVSVPLTDLRIWLGLTVVLLLFQSWITLGRAWRKDPPGFLWRSFMDARDVPDGKLLTVFNAVLVLNVTTAVGWVFDRWPPVYVWATWGTIVLLGIGADAYIVRTQIEATGGQTSLPGSYPGSEGTTEEPAPPAPTGAGGPPEPEPTPTPTFYP